MSKSTWFPVTALLLVSSLFWNGCGGGDSSPNQPPADTNSLTIDGNPDSLDAPWTVAGPEGFSRSGNGDATLTDLEPGQYFVVWGEVEGWYTPSQSSVTLSTDGDETLSGEYIFIGSGTIVIDLDPDEVGAGWTLAGPGSFSQTGTGDLTLVDMLPGSYTLTWASVTGWIRPDVDTQTLVADATITFTGTYTENQGTGTVTVTALPAYLDPPWSLRGPDGYIHDSNGTETLAGLTAGEYTVIWDNLSGWVTPEASHGLLLAGQSLDFEATYFEEEEVLGFRLLPPAQVVLPVGFLMGGKETADEMPHSVTLTHRFYLGETEVTNGQYVELLQWAFDRFYVVANPNTVGTNLDQGTARLLDLEDQDCQIDFNGGTFTTPYPDRPVIDLTWYGAAAFCDWMSMREGLPRAYNHYTWRCNNDDVYGAQGYRLPTEAEWELSCRAGTTTNYYTGDCLDSETEANYNGEYPYEACPAGPLLGRTDNVGSYPPNPWGLYDMHGNIFEWCQDFYDPYPGTVTDPIGPLTGTNRVIRGGAFSFEAVYCRSGARSNYAPNYLSAGTGFRVARSAH